MKQSPSQWYKRLNEFIVSHGYIRSPYDSCVYHSKVKDDSHIYLLLYGDDMLKASQNLLEIQKVKSLLNSEFEMKDLGVVEKILGTEIKRDKVQKKFFMHKKEFIQKVLTHFGMASAKQVCSPLAKSICLFELNTTQSESKKEYMSHVPNASFATSLMYDMVCTRSNLAQIVNVVSRHMGILGRNIGKL